MIRFFIDMHMSAGAEKQMTNEQLARSILIDNKCYRILTVNTSISLKCCLRILTAFNSSVRFMMRSEIYIKMIKIQFNWKTWIRTAKQSNHFTLKNCWGSSSLRHSLCTVSIQWTCLCVRCVAFLLYLSLLQYSFVYFVWSYVEFNEHLKQNKWVRMLSCFKLYVSVRIQRTQHTT